MSYKRGGGTPQSLLNEIQQRLAFMPSVLVSYVTVIHSGGPDNMSIAGLIGIRAKALGGRGDERMLGLYK
jgi:hypothetical protein